jgi:hypothetical protein
VQGRTGRHIKKLCNDAVSSSDYTASNGMMVNNLERISKWPWPTSRYYPSICLEGLEKISKDLSLDSRPPDLDLNLGFPECHSGVLTTRPRRSVNWYVTYPKQRLKVLVFTIYFLVLCSRNP